MHNRGVRARVVRGRSTSPPASYGMVELSDATIPTGGGPHGYYHRIEGRGDVCAEYDRAHDHTRTHARQLGASRTAHSASPGRATRPPAARARHRAPGWAAGFGTPADGADPHLLLWRP